MIKPRRPEPVIKQKKSEQFVGEIVYGAHTIMELLKAKRRKIHEFYILKEEPKIWRQIQDLLPKYKAPVHHLTKELLSKKLGTHDHQGLGALVAPFPLRKKFFNPVTEPFLVMIDGVQDVRNMGAIIRSAYCTGANGIIVCARMGTTLTGAAIKSSAGLAERMEICEVPSAAVGLQELRNAGYNVYVTALGGKTDATKMVYKKPLCVVIGSEERGVSPECLRAGTVVTLPQKTEDVSYNASVAAGIILFMVANQKTE